MIDAYRKENNMPRPKFNQEVHDRNQWLQTLDIKLLRQLAEQRGLSNYAKMSYAELVKALTFMDTCVNPLSTPKTDFTVQ